MTAVFPDMDARRRELRRHHIGSSEVAALFGEHPQLTHFALWNIKAGRLPEPDLSEDERILWGTLLEPAVAEGVRRVKGWTVRKVHRYLVHRRVVGMGASLDYSIGRTTDREPGVLEIKTADWLVARNWEDGEPPVNYLLQLQHQLAVTNRQWGAIATLIGGNELSIKEYERREKTIAMIELAVDAFWQSIHENRPPSADYARDIESITALYSTTVTGKVIDLAGDNRAAALIDSYAAMQRQESAAKAAKDAAKGELLEKIGDAEIAVCGNAKISTKRVAPCHVEYDREAYRSFRISVKK